MMTTLNSVMAMTTQAHSPPLRRERPRRRRERSRAADSRESAGGSGGEETVVSGKYVGTVGVLVRVGSARGNPFAVGAAWES